jgi:hypothetical protein
MASLFDHYLTNSCSSGFLEKLIVSQIAKKFPTYVESESSLLCSREPATGPFPEPDEPSPQLPIPFPQDPF